MSGRSTSRNARRYVKSGLKRDGGPLLLGLFLPLPEWPGIDPEPLDSPSPRLADEENLRHADCGGDVGDEPEVVKSIKKAELSTLKEQISFLI